MTACPRWTGTQSSTPTGRCWTGSAVPPNSPMCSGRSSASSARLMPTSWPRVSRSAPRARRRDLASACSEPTWSRTRTAPGGWPGSCRASRPTRGRARRWPRRALRWTSVTCWWPWTGSPSTAHPGAAGKPVELTTRRDGRLRRSVVVALKDEQRLRYQDWVARTRQRVRAASDGRLGYLHVPDMVAQGWADFHRDLRTEMSRDGLIIDVRCNHGGHTSQLVVEKLARKIIGWDVPRGQEPESYPGDAPRGPVVALADEFAGSDGDIVTAAIRSLGLGPVVGTRTWGGVIGIDVPLHELADGTSMSVPKYAFWFSEFGWGVENYGVDPDVEVIISPEDWAAGRDPQLEEAIRIALQQLAERPAAAPPDSSGRPSKRRPPLPPRSAGTTG